MSNKYWVSNGSDGFWNDSSHWSLSSGGNGGASVPSASDNAIFDFSSFTATGQTVTINDDAYCNDLSFIGVVHNPTLDGHRKLETYGDVVFATPANMTIIYDGLIKMHNGAIFNGNGQAFDVVRMLGTNIYSILGSNNIQSLIVEAGGTLKLKSGSFQTVGQLKAVGLASNHINIVSDTEGSFATIVSDSYQIFAKYCNIQDVHVSGEGKFQAIKCTDNGNTDGWDFVEGIVIPTGDSISSSMLNGYINVLGSDILIYEHPLSHPATIIDTDSNHQFVTQAEKDSYASGANIDLSGYYTKTQSDTLLVEKADASSVYTKAEADTKVATEIADLVASAPETLNTLNELATALGQDPEFATTIATQIGQKADASDVYTKIEVENSLSVKATIVDTVTALAEKANSADVITSLLGKVDKVTGKGLSTEDYTIAEKSKLSALNSANYEPVNSNIQSHIGSSSNPHSVTKSQVGLENVSNDTQLKVASNLSDVANVDTSKNNLGLGTQDSPQFKAVKVDDNYTVQSNNNVLEVILN